MLILLFSMLGCQPNLVPDGSWDVTVVGASNDCVDSTEGYLEQFKFNLFFDELDGTKAEVRIDDEVYATGAYRGCNFEYQSAIFLEDSPDGPFRWYISGNATIQTVPGLCDMPTENPVDGNGNPIFETDVSWDWHGTETLVVHESEHPEIEVGCEYLIHVRGTVSSDG